MKITSILFCSAIATACLTGCATEHHEHRHEMWKHCEKCRCHDHHDWQAKHDKLMREAKVSKETAEQTALGQVTNGIVKDSELEREHGKLQWSFDMTTPNSKEITEVNVDAITGKIISVQKESPESESKEADQEND